MKPGAACLIALTLAVAASAHADTVVVTAGRRVDAMAGRLLERPVITITDGRISAATAQRAPMPAAPMGAAARRIDPPGMTLLPGLIDMHVHLTGDPKLQRLSSVRIHR